MPKLLIIFFSIGIVVFLLTLFSPATPITPTSPKKPSPTPVVTTTLKPTPTPAPSVFNDTVPFILQAPLGEWNDPRQQDACEEASLMMAIKWAKGETAISPQEAKTELLQITDFQTQKYGDSRDTSARDTLQRIGKEFYKFDNGELRENITADNIIQELHAGNLVITPVNGQALNNPYFTQPGPKRHMVLIIGYDANSNEFITNDPGVGRGKNYRYPVDVFYNAVRDYETGYHLPIQGVKKNIIIVSRNNQKQP